jgi:hypothetical protein
MAQQMLKRLALTLLCKDVGLCALLVLPLLSVGSTLAGSAAASEITAPAELATKQPPPGDAPKADKSFDSGTAGEHTNGSANPHSPQINSEPVTAMPRVIFAAPAPCQGPKQFVQGTSRSGFNRYWLFDYRPEDTTCPFERESSFFRSEARFISGSMP